LTHFGHCVLIAEAFLTGPVALVQARGFDLPQCGADEIADAKCKYYLGVQQDGLQIVGKPRRCLPQSRTAMTDSPRYKSLQTPFDPEAFLSSPGVGITVERFQKNQEIFVQGKAADTVCYLQKGQVKATALSDRGKGTTVGIFREGQFFGEGCLNDGAKFRTKTTIALEQCLITSVRRDTMLLTLNTKPDFSAFFIARLISRNNRIEDDLIDQLVNRSSERRLARQLLLLADFEQEGNDKPITVIVSQEILAEMIGTTRSRVSTFMNKFRKKGLISYDSYHREIQVHRSLLDAVLRGMPRPKDDK
jgi:CRP/FNR family transcriptional regulator, cyclic AMP receptor protein